MTEKCWIMLKACKVLPFMVNGASSKVPPAGSEIPAATSHSIKPSGEAIPFQTDYEVRHLAPSKYPCLLDYDDDDNDIVCVCVYI